MPTGCWLLVGLPPVLVVLAAAALLLFNWWRFGDVRRYMSLHQRMLNNLREAVEVFGKDGQGPGPKELWAGDGRATLEYVADVFAEAMQWKEMATDLATLHQSEQWNQFWIDLEGVTEYAWRVALRRALETWATAALDLCPRAVRMDGTPHAWRDEMQACLSSTLCEIYEKVTEADGELNISEIVVSRIEERVITLAERVAPNPKEKRAASAWAKVALESLKSLPISAGN